MNYLKRSKALIHLNSSYARMVIEQDPIALNMKFNKIFINQMIILSLTIMKVYLIIKLL